MVFAYLWGDTCFTGVKRQDISDDVRFLMQLLVIFLHLFGEVFFGGVSYYNGEFDGVWDQGNIFVFMVIIGCLGHYCSDLFHQKFWAMK